MIAYLLTPFGRIVGAAAIIAAVALWGMAERAGRVAANARAEAAQHALAAAEQRIRNMEARHEADDAAARDRDPVGSLREWSRDKRGVRFLDTFPPARG